jgi:hypothetical protein
MLSDTLTQLQAFNDNEKVNHKIMLSDTLTQLQAFNDNEKVNHKCNTKH